MDPRAIRLQLAAALSSKDPYRIAAALELPSINAQSSSELSEKKYGNLSLQDSSGTEWGGVLSPLIQATDAASAVSNKYYISEPIYHKCVRIKQCFHIILFMHFLVQKGDAVRCYEAQSSLHAAFNHIFGVSAGNVLVPALHVVCRNTHAIAVLADLAKVGKGERNDHSRLHSAVTALQESFSKTLNDRKEWVPNSPLSEEGSKKAGVLFIVNQLFSMYFRLNTLRLW